MSSNVRLLFIVVFAFTGLLGCSDFLNGKKAEPQVIEMSDDRFACLGNVAGQLKSFSVGEAEKAELESGFGCLREALIYFNKRTYGQNKDSYTIDEMRSFFGRYFLKDNNVTPEFAAELMKLKHAIVGGNKTTISKTEIVRLVDVLNVLKEEAVRLAPHMKILTNQADPKTDWEAITSATEQFRASLIRILDQSEIPKADYTFEDTKALFSGLSTFVRRGERIAQYDIYSRYLPIVESVKTLLMGRQANFASATQWRDSLQSLIQVYELYLKYRYNLSDLKFDNTQKIRQLDQFINQTLRLVANSHQIKTRGFIPLADLDSAIDVILPAMKIPVQPDSLKKVYRAVLVKMLDPDRRVDSRGLIGLERKHLATLSREFNVWRLSQSFIDSINFNASGVSQAQLLKIYERFDKDYVIEKGLSNDPYEQRTLRQSWADLGEHLNSVMPVQYNYQGQVLIDASNAQTGQTWASLTKGNFIRFLSRMLLIGYGQGNVNSLSEGGIPQNGLVQWYEEFRPVFLDLGAFDPRTGNSGARSFLEASFFTVSGDGNELMDHKETFEFVSTLFAAGLATSEKLRAHAVAVGCGVQANDVFGKPFLKEECFRNEMRRSFGIYFGNMPGMAQYVLTLNEAQWVEFFNYLMAVSQAPNQPVGYVETSNIRTMVTILHYIETVVVMFDKDRNGLLSLDEVYAATPRFLSFLRTVAGTNNEMLLHEGFAYLVFKGGVPGASDLAGFQFSKLMGLGEAQRIQILRIFGTLKDQLNKPAK